VRDECSSAAASARASRISLALQSLRQRGLRGTSGHRRVVLLVLLFFLAFSSPLLLLVFLVRVCSSLESVELLASRGRRRR
jgi:hypothetical protein